MRELNVCEVGSVAGGEQPDYSDSFWAGSTNYTGSICYTVQVGPATSQTCTNSDGTQTVQTCLQAGPSVTVAGVGVGVTAQVCSTTTTGRYGNGNGATGGGYSGAGIGGSVSSGSTGSSHFG